MHVPHEVFYFVVFLLSSGLPEAMHLGFSFWRGCDVGVRVLVAWVMRSVVDGDGVATLLVHSVDGVCYLQVVLLLVGPLVLSAL